MLYHLLLSGIFFLEGGRGGGKGGLMLVQVFFLAGEGGGGAVLSLRDFLRFPFLPLYDHPCHLKSGELSPLNGVQHPFSSSSLECN